jgi:hypothetical protein
MILAQEETSMSDPNKSQSHGRIGEAATYAKCWMYGIPAYFTGGLRANFAGSDLIVETNDPRRKLWIQVKTGYPILKDHVYLTQCSSETELDNDKFSADFVVFVNLDSHSAKSHAHDGMLDFRHLSYYVVPRHDANQIYRKALRAQADKPKRDGGRRKLGNVAVHATVSEMSKYRDAWQLLQSDVFRT